MSDPARDIASVGGHDESPSNRRIWELTERLAELETELAERLERERLNELELAALRKDLEVQGAFQAAMEQAGAERRAHTEWLQARVEELSAATSAQRVRADALKTELDEAQADRDRLAAELHAERARVSYRMVQRGASTLSRRPRLYRASLAIIRLSSGPRRHQKP